jgi:site-specific recombinase XerC
MEKENATGGEAQRRGWKSELQGIIDANNHLRVNGKAARHKTKEDRAKFLFKMFTDLHGMGSGVQPRNFKEKHIRMVCEKFVADGLSPATIQNYASFIRTFCGWIKKGGMMRESANYFPDTSHLQRNYQATHDKSWEGNGVDKDQIFRTMMANEPWVFIQLLVCDAFGLRLKEVVSLRPGLNDKDGYLHIVDGSKGGRVRSIIIEDEYQREVVDRAKAMVKNSAAFLADPTKTLAQNMRKISNTMTKYGITRSGKGALGVTLHGLRAGFAIRKLEERGLVSVLRGGLPNIMSREEELATRQEVVLMLGHARDAIMNAYVPANTTISFKKIKKVQAEKLAKIVKEMVIGQNYKFDVLEHEDLDGTPVGAISFVREFRQSVQMAEKFYFHVKKTDDKKEHLIDAEHVAAIRQI